MGGSGAGDGREVFTWSAELMKVRADFEDRAKGPPHVKSCYVESGAFEITVAGEIGVLRGSDSFVVPSNAFHGAKRLAPGTLLDVFTPVAKAFRRFPDPNR